MHSILAAKLLGLKVEIHSNDEFNIWGELQQLLMTRMKERKYRIDYKEPVPLVPAEIWDILEEKYKYIAMSSFGDICALTTIPTTYSFGMGNGYWRNDDGEKIGLFGFKLLKDAKIHDVYWKDSLCVRPTK